MTRRDFNEVAAALAATRKDVNGTVAERYRRRVISDLGDALERLYPRFQRDRFTLACDTGIYSPRGASRRRAPRHRWVGSVWTEV